MKYYILIILIICSFLSAWERTYDFCAYDYFSDLISLDDGGFILAGHAGSRSPANGDWLIVRINSDGDTVWTKLLGGDRYDFAKRILAIDDTTFIISGVSSSSFPDEYNYLYLTRMTIDGGILWTAVCESLFYGHAIDIAEDGNLVVLDGSWPALAKYTMDGVGVWSARFSSYPYNYISTLYDMKRIINERYDYITAGDGKLTPGGDYNAVLACFDIHGDTSWVRHYGNSVDDHFYSVLEINNPAAGYEKGFIAVGSTKDAICCTSLFYAVRTNINGDTIWTQTYCHENYGGDVCNQRAQKVIWAGNEPYQTKFAIVGYTAFSESLGGKYATWLIVVSDTLRGDTLWTRTFDSHDEQIPYSMILCEDNGFAIVGSAEDSLLLPGPHIVNDCWMVRVDSLGNDLPYRIPENSSKPQSLFLAAHPNPFNSAVTITAPAGAEIEVFDVSGRKIADAELVEAGAVGDCKSHPSTGSGLAFIWQPGENIGSGVYLVRASMGGESVTKRVVYLK